MSEIYTQIKYLVFLFGCGLFWQGCNVINPPEQVPTYIHIDSFKFVANPAVLNVTLSHQISCVWVYYNNASVGVFDLPATFPVLANGTGTLEVFPGVTIDGQNNLTGIYPFYQPDTFSFAAQPGKIINHLPVTSYFPNIKVYNISNFNGSIDFVLDGSPMDMVPMTNITTSVPSQDSLVFEGFGSGRILLANPGDSSIDSSRMSFPISSGSAFIEFNYKNTAPFYVGLQANLSTLISSTPFYLTGIYPSSTWQKFYLSVADFAAQYQGTDYNLFIKASYPGAPGYVLLDNIQLITTD